MDVQKGENIKRLRREANAEIVLEDYVAGSEDRVLSVILHRDSPSHNITAGGDALVSVFHSFCELSRDFLMSTGSEEADVQEHEICVGSGSEDIASTRSSMLHDQDEFDFRMLVDASQVGFLVGKSGSAIKKTMDETRAYVKVLPKAELPGCALISDEVILVSGRHSAVCAALRLLARQLEEHPPRVYGNRKQPMLLAHASVGDASILSPPSQALYNTLAYSPGLLAGTIVETVFRLLAPKSRVGNIIGRNGEHVQRIRNETGSRIKVYDEDEADERLVCIFSTEDAASHYCSAQDALMRCAISLSPDDASVSQHQVRLLAPQVSVGAVLGKRGVTVMQLRQETGASIKVHPVEAPLAAVAANSRGGGEPGGDEIIQIDGNLQQCVVALRSVATLLRAWQIRRVATSLSRHPYSPIALAPGMFSHPVSLTTSMNPSAMVPFAMPAIGGSPGYRTPGYAPSEEDSIEWCESPVLWRYRLNNAQAGAIIGKGGHHVAQIRHFTGVRLHLPGEYAGEGLRTMEISGSYEACQAAHAMINQFLAMAQYPLVVPEHQSGGIMYPSDTCQDISN